MLEKLGLGRPHSPPDEHHGDLRERLLARLAHWVDEALAAGELPEGVPAELLAEEAPHHAGAPFSEAGDLFDMQATITALAQEMRLQGRSYQRLTEALAPLEELGATFDRQLAAHQESLTETRRLSTEARAARAERDALLAHQAEERARGELFDLLLDLRDRLTRGLDSARSHLVALATEPTGRLLGRRRRRALEQLHATTTALEHGYVLSLRRLEDALARLDIHPIAAAGLPFDPLLMNAVDVEETDEVADGTVLEIHRNGYQRRGQVLRTAQVKVARHPHSTA